MPFLQGVSSEKCSLVHHTGTMIRFTPSQLIDLPPSDTKCTIQLPDGALVEGYFRRNPANPYIAGLGVVKWIKSWVPYNQPADAIVHQVRGNQLRLEAATAVGKHRVSNAAVRNRARQIMKEPKSERRRRLYEAWERDPRLRAMVLAAWGPNCQVVGCTFLVSVPAHIQPNMVDVHHLNHVAHGGNDSPMNVCILCVVHHQLIHRAPVCSLRSWDIDGADVAVNGLTLAIVRDARSIL